ncbi:MAG: flagellar biosynthetic protein FliO [Cyanobacteriota bacterium]
MFYKTIKVIIPVIAVLFTCFIATYAEEFSNTVNSVKVQSAGDDSVVVDVYINSSDVNVKPQLSHRKYKDDKYVIDLMQVTQQGSVSKDTSASSGLVKSNDIKVGNLPGGTARVLIDLDNPNVKIKDVRYHVVEGSPVKTEKVDEKPKESIKVTAKPEPVTEPVKAPVVKPKSDNKPVVIAKPVENKPAPELKKEPAKIASKIEPKKEEKKNDSVITTPLPVIQPQIIHKTDAPKVAVKPKELPVIKKEPDNKAKNDEIKLKNIKIPDNDKKAEIKPEVKNEINDKSSLKVDNTVEIIHKTPEIKHEADKNLLVQANNKEIVSDVNADKKETVTDPEQTPLNLNPETNNENMKVVEVKNNEIDFMGMLLTLIGALVIVIPLIFIAVWLINVFYKGGDSIGLKTLSSMGGSNFKIVSSTSLGQGKSIHLVEIKGRQLVIGCTSNSINILTEFTDFDDFVEEQIDSKLDNKPVSSSTRYKKARPPLGSFAELYKDYTSKIEEDLEDEY